MKHKRSCDDHSKFRPGCLFCQRRQNAYESRRRVLAEQGKRLSAPAGMSADQIRQLRAAGYSLRYLAARTGIDPRALQHVSNGTRAWVQLRTFVAVNNLYQELRWFPGDDKRAAAHARKRGWTPPEPLPMPACVEEDSIDPIAVERAMRGDRVPLTRAEITEAWQRLERRRLPAHEIARLLHVAERTVQRWRDNGVATRRIRTQRTA